MSENKLPLLSFCFDSFERPQQVVVKMFRGRYKQTMQDRSIAEGRLLRRSLALFFCFALVSLANTGVAEESKPERPSPERRPKIGLVLSGGGARGVAHIGVLKALEQLHVPIDYIAGTSMGAVVGGLYASGMSPEAMERWFDDADWRYLLSDSPPRETRSLREKERDRRLNQNLEIGISRTGDVQLPVGFISGQKLLVNLRELTLPVRDVHDFDRLPIPFRAIATDLQTGEKIVLRNGDLADAMRASMAVPGIFTPYEMDGRSLVDGGLSSNLPIETVRAMGADIVIAVDVRPELKSSEELRSAIAVTNQMLDILIQRDTLAQIRTLQSGDVYIRLELPNAGSADFAGSAANIPAGYEKTLALTNQLRRYALSSAEFDRYLSTQRVARENGVAISFVEVNGASGPIRQSLKEQIKFAPGERIEIWQLQKHLLGLEGFRNKEIVDFRVIEEGDKHGLLLEMREKSRGPNYFNAGFDFAYSSSGQTDADLLLAFRMTELNSLGAEWETFLSLGDFTRVFSEFYQPIEPSRRLFLAVDLLYANQFVYALDAADDRLGFRLQTLQAAVDAGLRLGHFGELRVGYSRGASHLGSATELPKRDLGWSDRGELRAALTIDTLDRADFPKSGLFGSALATFSRKELGARENYSRLDAQLYKPITFGKNTIVPRVVATVSLNDSDISPFYDRSSLGGFLQLSGIARRGLYDQNALLAELIYYRELTKLPAALGGGLYLGLSAEAGNVYAQLDDVKPGNLKYGGSIFLGAETIIGPLYFGVGGAKGGEGAVYLQLSPIFRRDLNPR